MHELRRDLEAVLEQNGFRIERSSYFLFFLFPIVAAARIQEQLLTKLGRKPDSVRLGAVPAWASRLLEAVVRFEALLLSFTRLPIGVWTFALARRTEFDVVDPTVPGGGTRL